MTLAVSDRDFLLQAIALSEQSVSEGGFPAGAVIVHDGRIIGRGISIGGKLNDPTSHGEIAAIRDACQTLKTSSLAGCTLYGSMEPCLMCFGASSWSGLNRIVYACAKSSVSPDYYGGHYHMASLSRDLMAPITLMHTAEMEETALVIVRNWEKSLAV